MTTVVYIYIHGYIIHWLAIVCSFISLPWFLMMPRVHLTVPLRGKACSCATGIASWWCGQCATCRCLYLRSKLVQWQKPLDRKEVLTFTNKQFLYIFYTQIRDFCLAFDPLGFFEGTMAEMGLPSILRRRGEQRSPESPPRSPRWYPVSTWNSWNVGCWYIHVVN